MFRARGRAKKRPSAAADAGTVHAVQRCSMHELSKLVRTGRRVVHENDTTSMANLCGDAEQNIHGQNHYNVNNALALVKKAQGGICVGSRDFGDRGVTATTRALKPGLVTWRSRLLGRAVPPLLALLALLAFLAFLALLAFLPLPMPQANPLREPLLILLRIPILTPTPTPTPTMAAPESPYTP